MPTLTINGKEVTVPRGTPVIRAAAMLGFNIPHFCYHPALSAPANCRMCLVEIERARKLEPACYAKCGDGMVVHTESEKVKVARRAVLEFILVNHPVDCPICDQAGECKLQDYYMAYDAEPSRLRTSKVGKSKVFPIGPHVVYDGERCILCTRCVRFCDQITGTSELAVVQRGDDSTIGTFPGRELDNAYSMNVTDICPVGALTTRDFRFKCRVWLLSSTDSICTGCSRGCNVHLEHFQGEVQRYRPRFNPEVNEYWMCDEGRLSYKQIHARRNVTLRVGDKSDLGWPRSARTFGALAKDRIGAGGDGVAFVASPLATTEGLYAGRKYAETVLGAKRFYVGGRADGDADAFLIRADKNPNRAGVTAVFGELPGVDALLDDMAAGRVRALWLMGTELAFDDAQRARFTELVQKLDLFVVQSLHDDALLAHADAVFPAASHAELEGTYINEQGHVQQVYKALEPEGPSRSDAEIFIRLAKGADQPFAFTDVDGIRAELYDSGAEA